MIITFRRYKDVLADICRSQGRTERENNQEELEYAVHANI